MNSAAGVPSRFELWPENQQKRVWNGKKTGEFGNAELVKEIDPTLNRMKMLGSEKFCCVWERKWTRTHLFGGRMAEDAM